MKNTNQASRYLGITRTHLYFLCLHAGVQPKKKIIDGRAHNYYSDDDLKALQMTLKMKVGMK